ncbi:MAG: SDR family NAD(P)-dependent oxidoreductase, partial [Clostridiales bacterium]
MFAKRFAGHNMIVTGATSGIGKEVALRAALEGANVVVAGRNQQRGQAVVDEIIKNGGEAIFVATDVTKKEDIIHLFAQAENKYGE